MHAGKWKLHVWPAEAKPETWFAGFLAKGNKKPDSMWQREKKAKKREKERKMEKEKPDRREMKELNVKRKKLRSQVSSSIREKNPQ